MEPLCKALDMIIKACFFLVSLKVLPGLEVTLICVIVDNHRLSQRFYGILLNKSFKKH